MEEQFPMTQEQYEQSFQKVPAQAVKCQAGGVAQCLQLPSPTEAAEAKVVTLERQVAALRTVLNEKDRQLRYAREELMTALKERALK